MCALNEYNEPVGIKPYECNLLPSDVRAYNGAF